MYLSFYKLREEPFRLTPDPRFFHLAEPHRIALTTLVKTVLYRKGFAVVVGPIGTGKTTLLHAALQVLSDKRFAEKPIATAFLFNPTLKREEFLEAVLAEFGIECPSPSKPQRLAALHRMLLQTQQQGGTSVLFVDEAHLLSQELLEEIRLLSNADSRQEKLLQIVLCGQPELLSLLTRPLLRSLRQRIASPCQLRGLSLTETRAYIAERLNAAGLRGPSPFLGLSVESIYQYSRGVPRLLNLICDSSLSIGYETKRAQIAPDVVEEAAVELGLAKRSVQAATPPPKSEGGGPVDSMLIETLRQGSTGTRVE